MKERKTMNRSVITLFAIALLGTTSLLAQNVTFGDTTLAAGTSWTETSSYGSSIDFTVDNGMSGDDPDINGNTQLTPYRHQTASISRSKQVTITSTKANGKKIGGFTVAYSSVVINGVAQTMFAGKQYAIDVNGNHVNSITYANGTPVPDSELAFVTADNSNINQALELANTLGGETIAIGSAVRAKNLDDLFDVTAGFAVDDCTLTLASVSSGDNPVATFTLSLSISSSAGGGIRKHKNADPSAGAPFSTSSLHLGPLVGELHADVGSGRVLDFSVTGPATAGGNSTLTKSYGKDRNGRDLVGKKSNGDPRSMSVNGSGSATLAASFTYPPPDPGRD